MHLCSQLQLFTLQMVIACSKPNSGFSDAKATLLNALKPGITIKFNFIVKHALHKHHEIFHIFCGHPLEWRWETTSRVCNVTACKCTVQWAVLVHYEKVTPDQAHMGLLTCCFTSPVSRLCSDVNHIRCMYNHGIRSVFHDMIKVAASVWV